jgi:polyphosphate kinase 2 (PPK2 family)
MSEEERAAPRGGPPPRDHLQDAHRPSIFDTAELGRAISDRVYKEEEPLLRTRLLQAQFQLLEADFPVIILMAGVDKAGKRELANILSAWMDPRLLVTRAFSAPTDFEAARPDYWRYWLSLPPKGRVGIYLSAWYSRPLLDQVYGRTDIHEFDEALEEVGNFERTLADDGALIIKFWMHLGKEQQKQRLEALQADPLQAWRVHPEDWENWNHYDDFARAGEHLIARTSTGSALWKIVEGADPNYRSLMVGSMLCEAVEHHLAHRKHLAELRASEPRYHPSDSITRLLREASRPVDGGADPRTEDDESPVEADQGPMTILSRLDMDQELPKKLYKTRQRELQARLALLHRQAKAEDIPLALLFEGWDAAGKGGAIRRLTGALDARDYEVIPVAAPTDEEAARHYLWRFWRRLPGKGRVTIFDRSWYGRVLVERVEGFAREEEWQRAYGEINEFERQIAASDLVLVKFWIHITKDEQAKRFEARKGTPHKAWKLTDEDWRNREKWDAYAVAVHNMVQLTSTAEAPWTLVEGNDKYWARIRVLETVCDALEGALKNPPTDLLERIAASSS